MQPLALGFVEAAYLTEAEVERVLKAAKANRYGRRDATMMLVAYRHGLRAYRQFPRGHQHSAQLVPIVETRRQNRGVARPVSNVS